MKRYTAKKLTPEQESDLQEADMQHIRADILVAGVAKLIADGAHCGNSFIRECSGALDDAADLHEEAFELEDHASKGIDDGPPVRMRRVRRSAGRKPGAAATKKKGVK